MKHQPRWIASTGALVVAVVLAVSAAAPAKAVVLYGNQCVGDLWNLDCPAGELGTEISITAESQGVGESASLDIVFDVDLNSNGSDPIRIDFTAINSSPRAWTGFVFLLGFGVGEEFVLATYSANSLLWLDSDNPDFLTTSTVFTTAVPTSEAHPHMWRFSDSGNTVPVGGSVDFTVWVTVTDPITSFTVRQYAVPEPNTVALLGLGFAALGLTGFGWSRRKKV